MDIQDEELTNPYEEQYKKLNDQVNPNNEELIYTLYMKYILMTMLEKNAIDFILEQFMLTSVNVISKHIMMVLFKSVAILKNGENVNLENLKRPYLPPTLISIASEKMNEYIITEEEKQNWHQLFVSLNPLHGFVEGKRMKSFAFSTKVSIESLQTIWTYVDTDEDGLINEGEFYVFVKLCLLSQRGVSLPQTLPPCLLKYIRIGPTKPESLPNTGNEKLSDLIQFPSGFVPDSHQQILIQSIESKLVERKTMNEEIKKHLASIDDLQKTFDGLKQQLELEQRVYHDVRKSEISMVAQLEKAKAEKLI